MIMPYCGTYAVEATELSEEGRVLLMEIDNSLIAHTESECDSKLILVRKIRFVKPHNFGKS